MSKEITVVCGAVPDFAIGKVLKDVMKNRIHQEFWESGSHSIRDGVAHEVVNDSNIPTDELTEVMYCLDDHMDNMDLDKLESWMSHSKDLVVDKEDELLVEVYYGIYHGPFNTKVHVWYVTI